MTIEQLVDKYESLSEKIRQATLSGDYINNNKAGKEQRKLYKKILKNKELAISVLTSLLKSSNVVARISAATHCLKLNINVDMSLKILKDISQNKDYGIFSLNAEMTLKMYNGEIPNRTL